MMTPKPVWFCCLAAAMLLLVDTECGLLPGPAIHLTTSPSQKSRGVVGPHTVACTLDAKMTSMEKVTAVTLYGSKPYGTADQFEPLATVDLWRPQARAVGGLTGADVDVFGGIGDGDEATWQLGISWNHQIASCPTQYRCVADGLDKGGQVVSISITSAASSTSADLDGTDTSQTDTQSSDPGFQNLTSRLDAVQGAVDLLLDNQATILHNQATIIQNLTSTILDNQATILRELKLAKLGPALDSFDVSAVFEGKRYLASKAVRPFDIRTADLRCELMGGHLLETGDQDEYDFVFKFLKTLGGDNFFTGANDIDEEGVWTYWHSGNPVTYANWNSGQPNDYQGNEDCLEIRISMGASNDWHCTAAANFVCEVSV